MVLNDFTEDQVLGLRAELLAYRLLFGPDLVRHTLPFAHEWGIIGAGIYAPSMKPFVYVRSEYLPANTIAPAHQLPSVSHVLDLVGIGGEGWGDVVAWGTPDPELQVNTGDVVRASKRGTAGPPVQWGSPPTYGILVSGHVVGAAKTVNDASNNVIGNVKESHEATTAGIDIALVELAAASGSARFARRGQLVGKTQIDLIKSGGASTDSIIAKAGWLYFNRYSATYLDIYVTNSVISAAGDSGSAAIVTGTRDVVGTLVGSSTGSLIQDMNTQLGAFKSVTNLSL
jgi:hypothetical protein